MSVVSLLVALTAIALSVYAIGVANDRTAATGGRPGGPPPGGPGNPPPPGPASAAPTVGSTPGGDSSPGELNPRAAFTDAYSPTNQTLQIHPDRGDYNYVDLDRPQVGVDSSVAELYLYQGGGEETFQFQDGVAVATASDPNVQPSDCVDLIRTSALPGGGRIPVGTPNLTLCITTSFSQAKNAGTSWKMVVLHVSGISNDGTVQVDVRAWNIPD
jgi:hypothetical protein